MKEVRLDPRHRRILLEILERHPSVQKAAVFGSRALGTNDRTSDIDLVLYGNVEEHTLGKIRTAIDDTTLPYFVDIIAYHAIHNNALLRHIDEHGLVIFEQPRKTSA